MRFAICPGSHLNRRKSAVLVADKIVVPVIPRNGNPSNPILEMDESAKFDETWLMESRIRGISALVKVKAGDQGKPGRGS